MHSRWRSTARPCRGGSGSEETDLRSRRSRRGAGTAPPASSRSRSSLFLEHLREAGDDVDREREDDGRVLLDADLRERLEIAQLQRGRLGGEDLRGIGETL